MLTYFEWRDAPVADYAVIGDPISHSRSPQMMAAAFAALGLPRRYVALRVSPGEVASAFEHLARLGYRGVNVTVPLKAEAYAASGTTDSFAARCGVINAVDLRDLRAMNTDGSGFLDTIRGLVPVGSSVLLLGAGGSARAIALAVALEGYNLRIFNRTPERAHALVRDLGITATVVDDPALKDVQLIVNATSASLSDDALPIPFTGSPPALIAYDLFYGDTAFLRSARAAGLRIVDGKPLLVAQGARSLEFWLGVEAPRAVMLEAIQ